jgi:hypothetical protein
LRRVDGLATLGSAPSAGDAHEVPNMRSIRSRRPGVAALVIAIGLLVGAGIAPVTAASPYVKDVYFSAGYERQVDGRTCVAASTAMILNFIARRDLGLDQYRILRYAQVNDALNDATQRGSDPLGWARALTAFSDRTGREFTYRWEAHSTESAALKRAARIIASTSKPVGLTVMNGRHAVVMTGFEASRDPLRGDFTLQAVWISDPIGSSHKRYAASDSPTNKYLELDATATYDKAWYGKNVIVVPEDRVVISRG